MGSATAAESRDGEQEGKRKATSIQRIRWSEGGNQRCRHVCRMDEWRKWKRSAKINSRSPSPPSRTSSSSRSLHTGHDERRARLKGGVWHTFSGDLTRWHPPIGKCGHYFLIEHLPQPLFADLRRRALQGTTKTRHEQQRPRKAHISQTHFFSFSILQHSLLKHTRFQMIPFIASDIRYFFGGGWLSLASLASFPCPSPLSLSTSIAPPPASSVADGIGWALGVPSVDAVPSTLTFSCFFSVISMIICHISEIQFCLNNVYFDYGIIQKTYVLT